MLTRSRIRWLFAALLTSGFVLVASRADALTESEIRLLAQAAAQHAKDGDWEKARQIYEGLLSQKDHGLNIRDRHQQSLRRCWQIRRHDDTSYRKEVLSIEYGQALRIHNVISNALLDGSVDKKNVDPARLFRKGIEELDAALGNPTFVQHHLRGAKPNDIEEFRAHLRKTSGNVGALSRKDAAKQLGDIAMAAELHLKLDATVVVMEFACGACYAIDDYTVYLTPNQLRELTRSLARTEAVGVGLTLAILDNNVVIQQVAMYSPAAQLDPPLGMNDQLISVDKKAVVDLPLQTVKSLLEGRVGTAVEIEVMSAEDGSIRMIRLERQPAFVNYFMLPGSSYGYLRISGFSESTAQDVDFAVSNLNGMKGLIIDLRSNNGGVFDSAIDTARRFLSTGIICSTVHQDPTYNFVYQAKNPDALAIPLTVLVDGDTASAAEVLAGALKDNKRAILIGQTTFGKGCTQRVLKLPHAPGGVPTGGMKLTVERFFSPKGVPYSGRGIVPHIILDERMTMSQAAMGTNLYVDRAVEELNRLVAAQK